MVGPSWGTAFRKFSTLYTDYLRVPSQRFLNFWNRLLPIPCQLTWGEGAPAESFSTPSTRRVPCPPGQEEPGWNGRKDLSSLIDIIARTRSLVLTKPENYRIRPAVPQARGLDGRVPPVTVVLRAEEPFPDGFDCRCLGVP
jgi:hypothetical protein